MFKIMTDKKFDEELRRAREEVHEKVWLNERMERLERDIYRLSDRVAMLEGNGTPVFHDMKVEE